jgi:hypothetical protein
MGTPSAAQSTSRPTLTNPRPSASSAKPQPKPRTDHTHRPQSPAMRRASPSAQDGWGSWWGEGVLNTWARHRTGDWGWTVPRGEGAGETTQGNRTAATAQAVALGVGQTAVRRDVAVSGVPHGSPDSESVRVTGGDAKAVPFGGFYSWCLAGAGRGAWLWGVDLEGVGGVAGVKRTGQWVRVLGSGLAVGCLVVLGGRRT